MDPTGATDMYVILAVVWILGALLVGILWLVVVRK